MATEARDALWLRGVALRDDGDNERPPARDPAPLRTDMVVLLGLSGWIDGGADREPRIDALALCRVEWCMVAGEAFRDANVL